MTKATFTYVCDELLPQLTKEDTRMSKATTVRKAITVRRESLLLCGGWQRILNVEALHIGVGYLDHLFASLRRKFVS